MSDHFNLRTLIREVCDTSSATAPELLVKEVLRRIDRRDAQVALEQALPYIVHSVVSSHRFTAPPPGRPHTAPADQTAFDALADDVSGGATPIKQPRSTKVASIRDTIGRALRERISVGHDRSEWKFLGDCTADDLEYAARLRHDLARANAARARQLHELADALRESGVETVRELPDLAARLDMAA